MGSPARLSAVNPESQPNRIITASRVRFPLLGKCADHDGRSDSRRFKKTEHILVVAMCQRGLGEFFLTPKKETLGEKKRPFCLQFCCIQIWSWKPCGWLAKHFRQKNPKEARGQNVTSRAFHTSRLACPTEELISSFLVPIRIRYFCYHCLLKFVLINDYKFSFNSVLQLKLF